MIKMVYTHDELVERVHHLEKMYENTKQLHDYWHERYQEVQDDYKHEHHEKMSAIKRSIKLGFEVFELQVENERLKEKIKQLEKGDGHE